MSGLIGSLRARVTLQEPVRTADDIGGAAFVWTDRANAWARVTARGGGEAAAYDGAVSTARYDVVLRERNDLRPGWRLIWRGRALRIAALSVQDDGRMTLDCVEETL